MRRNLLKTLFATAIVVAQVGIFTAEAQTQQVGYIKEYNGENQKTPLSGVEINIKNAGSTVSAQDGRFILEFRTMRPGQRVSVTSIVKEGYEILNLDALEQWNISVDEPFVIVMVKSANFKNLCDRYYSNCSNSYRVQHERMLERLEQERQQNRISEQAYEEERTRLVNEYEQRLQDLTSYIDRFARIDLENLSVVEKEIVAAIEEGRIDEAIQMYEDQRFLETYIRQVEQRNEELDKMNAEIAQTYEAIERQVLIYLLAGGEENFQKVYDVYEAILAVDVTNTKAASDYASFLIQQGDVERSVEVSLLVLQSNPDVDTYSDVCHNLAGAYILLRDTDKALEYAMAGLAVCSEDEAMYYVHLQNMGEIYSVQGEFDKAIEVLTPILDSEYAHVIAKSSAANSLGNMYVARGMWREAIDVFNIQAALYTGIAKDGTVMIDKIESQHSLMAAYLGLARAYTEIGDFDAAIKSYDLGGEICNMLYKYNPEKYRGSLYVIHLNSGYMYNALGDNVKALEHMEIAYEHVQELYKQSPGVHGIEYYQTLNNLGYLAYMSKLYAKSEIYYDRALGFISELYERSPLPDVKLEYARININFMSLYNDQAKYTKSLEKAEMAVALMDDVYAIYGAEAVAYEHGLAYRGYIIALHGSGRTGDVKSALERYKSMYGECAQYYNIQGEMALLSGKTKKAEQMYRLAIEADANFYVTIPSPLYDMFGAANN